MIDLNRGIVMTIAELRETALATETELQAYKKYNADLQTRVIELELEVRRLEDIIKHIQAPLGNN